MAFIVVFIVFVTVFMTLDNEEGDGTVGGVKGTMISCSCVVLCSVV